MQSPNKPSQLTHASNGLEKQAIKRLRDSCLGRYAFTE